MFGLIPEQWQIIKTKALAPLSALGATVYVFGSRARGDQHPFSDLDLMVEGLTPAHFAQLGAIKEALIESNLTIKVDLVLRQDFAVGYEAAYLKERVKVL